MIHTGGGKFNPKDGPISFLASHGSMLDMGAAMHDYLLIAVNELDGAGEMRFFKSYLERDKTVFLDSGIFNLTNQHAIRHEIRMDQALALAPDEIDGFDDLWKRYVDLVTTYGDQTWGYIELDQGGRENKIKTRARLEALGLRPIPVYHPLNDGWEYFDYLAERYDRICFGNIVQADAQTRKRLIATAWERHRKYPHVWIHLLGYTPNHVLYALPINSGDSSSWLSAIRWKGYRETVAGINFSAMDDEFQYAPGTPAEGPTGYVKATKLAAFGASMAQRNWRYHMQRLEAVGCALYPPPTPGKEDDDAPDHGSI